MCYEYTILIDLLIKANQSLYNNKLYRNSLKMVQWKSRERKLNLSCLTSKQITWT